MFIWLNVPIGGEAAPLSLRPQHAMVLSVLMPQADWKPGATCLNAPTGGVDCPHELAPQHASVVSTLTPQANA